MSEQSAEFLAYWFIDLGEKAGNGKAPELIDGPHLIKVAQALISEKQARQAAEDRIASQIPALHQCVAERDAIIAELKEDRLSYRRVAERLEREKNTAVETKEQAEAKLREAEALIKSLAWEDDITEFEHHMAQAQKKYPKLPA